MRAALLTCLLAASETFAQRVPWAVETSPIPSTRAGDPTFVSVAGVQLIVGTDTAQQGIFLWPPGRSPTVLPVGLVNGADARNDLLVVSSQLTNSLLVYRVRDGGIDALDTGAFNVTSPNHVALARHSDGGFDVWVDTSSLTVQHFNLNPRSDGTVTFTALPSVTVPEVPSGLAVDERSGRLYVAQPSLGVIRVEPNGAAAFLLSIDAGQLGATVGGLDLFLAASGSALLFSAAPNEGEVKVHSHDGTQVRFLASLQLGDTDGGPGLITQTRFLDVFEQAVPGFPRGVLIVQDEVAGNYKVVSLAAVDAVVPLPPAFIPGAVDAGPPDAGTATDGGADAGRGDGGSMSGTGGGSGGRPPGPAPGVEPMPPSCGCTGGPFGMLPALLLLWWIRRLRNTPS